MHLQNAIDGDDNIAEGDSSILKTLTRLQKGFCCHVAAVFWILHADQHR